MPSDISEPLIINGMVMSNRTFYAPMTRRAADPTSRGPTEAVAEYYGRRAAGGFGLIVTEGVFVNDNNAMNREMCPLCRTDEQVAMWKRVVDVCKAANPNVKMCMQLWHVGVWSVSPIAPSDSPLPGYNIKNVDPNAEQQPPLVAKAATDAELESIINDFTITAVNAVTRCGFDAVQVHGAHGYFVDIFSDVFYNKRKAEEGMSFTDESVSSRGGFAAAIVESLRAALGPKIPILMRFSQWEVQDLNCIKFANSAALAEFLYTLQDAGVDAFDVSARLWSAPAFPNEKEVVNNSALGEGEHCAAPSPRASLGLAAYCKQLLMDRPENRQKASDADKNSVGFSAVTIPAVMAVGGITISRLFLDVAAIEVTPDSSYALTDPTPALEALAEGAFEMIGVGRAALTNPDWPNKVLSGEWATLKTFKDADKAYGKL